jgi:hypothetical protein
LSRLDVHNPNQVSSWKEIDVVLADPTRRMRIISGIAIPEFQVDDDDDASHTRVRRAPGGHPAGFHLSDMPGRAGQYQ